MTLFAFTALATSVSAQTGTPAAAPPKATATAATTPAATTPAATTPAATTPAATTPAAKAATKAVEAESNTTMYLLIGVGAIVVIGGAWYMKKRRS